MKNTKKYILPSMISVTLVSFIFMVFSQNQVMNRIAMLLAVWSALIGLFFGIRDSNQIKDNISLTKDDLKPIESTIASSLEKERIDLRAFKNEMQEQLNKLSNSQIVVNNSPLNWSNNVNYEEKFTALQSELNNLKSIVSDFVSGPLINELREIKSMNLEALQNNLATRIEITSEKIAENTNDAMENFSDNLYNPYVDKDNAEEKIASNIVVNKFETKSSDSENTKNLTKDIGKKDKETVVGELKDNSASILITESEPIRTEEEVPASKINVDEILQKQATPNRRRRRQGVSVDSLLSNASTKNKHSTRSNISDSRLTTEFKTKRSFKPESKKEAFKKAEDRNIKYLNTNTAKNENIDNEDLYIDSKEFEKKKFRPKGFDSDGFDSSDITFEFFERK